MNNLSIKVTENKVFLDGDISYETVVVALQLNIFSSNHSADKSVLVDFSGIGHADSSGLALMLHWLRSAKKKEIDVQFFHVPKKLMALAEMSNLEEVLPVF